MLISLERSQSAGVRGSLSVAVCGGLCCIIHNITILSMVACAKLACDQPTALLHAEKFMLPWGEEATSESMARPEAFGTRGHLMQVAVIL